MEEPHDFPWDFVKMVKSGDPDLAKEFPVNLDRLSRVFDARHRFIHETGLLAEGDQSDLLDDDALGGAGDALWLVSTFQRQFEHLHLWSQYSGIREDEGLNDAVERNLKDIQAAIALVKAECDETQFESLEKFEKALDDCLWARSEFYASVFVPQLRYEAAASHFIDLAPVYRNILKGLALKQRAALLQWPIEKQYEDLEKDILG
jgi:hypothetical protein